MPEFVTKSNVKSNVPRMIASYRLQEDNGIGKPLLDAVGVKDPSPSSAPSPSLRHGLSEGSDWTCMASHNPTTVVGSSGRGNRANLARFREKSHVESSHQKEGHVFEVAFTFAFILTFRSRRFRAKQGGFRLNQWATVPVDDG